MNAKQRSPQTAQLSREDLMALGVSNMAYVKPIVRDGQALVSVHAADGTEISVLPNRELAYAVIRQHDLEPQSVH